MKFVLNEYHRNISDQELLDDIKRVMGIVNTGTLTTSDYRKYGRFGVKTVIRHFGSWLNALQLCNAKINDFQSYASKVINRNHHHISDEDLLADVRNVAVMLGKETINSSEYQQHSKYSANLCFKRFSSWNNTLKVAGLVPFPHGHKIHPIMICSQKSDVCGKNLGVSLR